LDALLVNNAEITSNPCNSTDYPWLNCLESNIMPITLPRCSSNYRLNLSYSNSKYKNEYQTGSPNPITLPTPTAYTHNIVITCM